MEIDNGETNGIDGNSIEVHADASDLLGYDKLLDGGKKPDIIENIPAKINPDPTSEIEDPEMGRALTRRPVSNPVKDPLITDTAKINVTASTKKKPNTIRSSKKRLGDSSDQQDSWIPNANQREQNALRVLKSCELPADRFIFLCGETTLFSGDKFAFQRYLANRCVNLTKMGHALKIVSPYMSVNTFLEIVIILLLSKYQPTRTRWWIHPQVR